MTYRCALITGASSGIGAAFARLLPGETDLLLTGRDQRRLRALARELAAPGRRVEILVADLAEAGKRRRLIDAAEEMGVDLFVNNAGLGAFGAMTETRALDENQMVAVNCVAVAHLTHGLLPGLLARARQSGRRSGLIVVASTAALNPLPYLATYAATKAFDYYLAEGLASEMADEPLDVLTLCPGPTETRFFERAKGKPAGSSGMASAEAVAKAGLKALGRKRVEIVGAGNKAYALALRLLPRAVMRPAVKRAMAKSVGKT